MMGSKTRLNLFFFVPAIVGIVAAFSVAMADPVEIEREIHLKPTVEVWSQDVCLGDLVEDAWMRGRCALDAKTCCRWALDGSRGKVFSSSELNREIAKIKLPGLKLVAIGPSKVAVTQTRRALTQREIAEKIIAAVASKLGEQRRNVTVLNLRLQPQPYVALAKESEWDVILPEIISENAAIKIVSKDNAMEALGWAQSILRVEGDAYVAKSTLHPSDPITAENIQLSKVDLLALQASGMTPFGKDQPPTNMRARQTILKGQALTASSLEKIPAVKLGDSVTLILRSDALKISTKGVAQGNAAIGDMLTVQLARYNRTFRGRLLDGQMVEVWF